MHTWKRIAVVTLGLALVAGVAVADISIVFSTLSGALMIHNGGQNYPTDALPSGSMIQLIWSTVSGYVDSSTPASRTDAQGNTIVQPVFDGPNAANSWLLWTGYTPAEASPGTIELASDIDGNFDYLNSHVGGNNVNAGYIYARIFESAVPVLDTWYANSAIYNTSLFAVRPPPVGDPLPAPSEIDVVNGAPGVIVGTGDFEGVQFNQMNDGQVVPEPSTLLLALAGAGLLVYRRFRK